MVRFHPATRCIAAGLWLLAWRSSAAMQLASGTVLTPGSKGEHPVSRIATHETPDHCTRELRQRQDLLLAISTNGNHGKLIGYLSEP
jgi:hypothetical protein